MNLIRQSLFVAGLIGVAVVLTHAATLPADDDEVVVTVTAVPSDGQSVVQLSVGDMVIQAKELVIVKDVKPDMMLAAAGQVVEIRRGQTVVTAKSINATPELFSKSAKF
jgi:hypothetical protein